MGQWISADIGFGWHLGGDEDGEYTIPWLQELYEQKLEEDEELEIVEVIHERLHHAFFPDEPKKNYYWNPDKRIGAQVEYQYVNDYGQGVLLLLTSRSKSTYDSITGLPFDLLSAPFTDQERETLSRVAEALELPVAEAGWFLGVSYG